MAVAAFSMELRDQSLPFPAGIIPQSWNEHSSELPAIPVYSVRSKGEGAVFLFNDDPWAEKGTVNSG